MNKNIKRVLMLTVTAFVIGGSAGIYSNLKEQPLVETVNAVQVQQKEEIPAVDKIENVKLSDTVVNNVKIDEPVKVVEEKAVVKEVKPTITQPKPQTTAPAKTSTASSTTATTTAKTTTTTKVATVVKPATKQIATVPVPAPQIAVTKAPTVVASATNNLSKSMENMSSLKSLVNSLPENDIGAFDANRLIFSTINGVQSIVKVNNSCTIYLESEADSTTYNIIKVFLTEVSGATDANEMVTKLKKFENIFFNENATTDELKFVDASASAVKTSSGRFKYQILSDGMQVIFKLNAI
ncbi:hypothetical protein LGK97_08290 [Clostridium sp. CS001]|uniref:hypothetical protein n=1 Tax=Clostridium sp. CS001 TaxID=2880648 RepID=UPI001CF4123D|nr:hypothetical protein [Clostridium sp. CS001]MCB2289763.1 hypothetical protein [Clostridium sp. CS001]